MKFTKKNLEDALRAIKPESYDNFKRDANLSLPRLIALMFEIGFFRILKSSSRSAHVTGLTEDQIDILVRAYDGLESKGLKFEEEN